MRKTYTEKGLTLIELIMAIVVGSLILIPTSIVIYESVRNTFLPEYFTTASSLLEGEIERVTNLRFSNVTNESGSFSGDFSDYSYEVSFYYVDDSDLETESTSPTTDYKRVQIAISRSGFPNVTATTVLTDN